MRAIKALVIFMGILLAAGIGLVVYGVMAKFNKPTTPSHAGAESPIPSGGPANQGSLPANFGTMNLPLPTGAKVEQVLSAGDRLVVKLGGTGDALPRLLVIDPARGSLVGTITFTPPAPPASPSTPAAAPTHK